VGRAFGAGRAAWLYAKIVSIIVPSGDGADPGDAESDER
jgi:hypothetical protein